MTSSPTPSGTAPGLRRRPAVVFWVVTVGVSAGFWVAGGVFPQEVLVAGLPVSAGMFLAPGLGAWAAGVSWRAPEDVRGALPPGGLLRRLAVWALVMPVVAAGAFVSLRMVGREVPPHLDTSLGAVVVLVLVFVATSTCEEFGWTRFLTYEALRRHGHAPVGIVIGTAWAALHVIPYLQAGRSWSWVLCQGAFTVAFRVLIVAAVVLTSWRWSVAVVLHASYDVAWALFPVGGSFYDPRAMAVLTALVALGFFLARDDARSALGVAARGSSAAPRPRPGDGAGSI
jgi:membrane protease YdiL (CAAX protease family)